jgi:hypothetical protein
VRLTVTDMAPEEVRSKGWMNTDQHATTIDMLFMPHLIDRLTFDRNVALRYVDMKAIPSDLKDYDFCWSVCALEHLGSIAEGLAFVRNSPATLRPGGVAHVARTRPCAPSTNAERGLFPADDQKVTPIAQESVVIM